MLGWSNGNLYGKSSTYSISRNLNTKFFTQFNVISSTFLFKSKKYLFPLRECGAWAQVLANIFLPVIKFIHNSFQCQQNRKMEKNIFFWCEIVGGWADSNILQRLHFRKVVVGSFLAHLVSFE
jgi:hypothetical protein